VIDVDGFRLEQPASFRTNEVRLEEAPGGPTIVVQSRQVSEAENAESLGAELLSQLANVPGVSNAAQAEMAFDDGGKGSVVSCRLSSDRGELRQYCVLRVHEGRVCIASVTSPVSDVTQATAMALMRCLASLRPAVS
jgi:hypothetical protein